MSEQPSMEGWEASEDFGATEELFGAVISWLKKEEYVYDEAEIEALFVNVDTATSYSYNDALENARTYLLEKGVDFDEIFGEDAEVLLPFDEEAPYLEPPLEDFIDQE